MCISFDPEIPILTTYDRDTRCHKQNNVYRLSVTALFLRTKVTNNLNANLYKLYNLWYKHASNTTQM